MAKNAKHSNIYDSLSTLDFSKNANLSQIIVDWPRLKNILSINGEKLTDVAEKLSINLNDLNTGHIDDQKKMEKILTLLFEDMIDKESLSGHQKFDPKTFDFNQLGEILHQGGILFSLETKVKEALNINGMHMPNKGFSRSIDLITTDTGFEVKQLFEYNANILDKEDPEIVRIKKVEHQKGPLLTGICKYKVEVKQEKVTPIFEGFQIATENKNLQPLLMANTLHQNRIKETLQEAKNNSESNQTTFKPSI